MDAEPVVHIRELRDGIAFKGTELLPGHCAHFRFAVEKRGADLEVVVRRTFGGAPALLLNYGELPAETQHHDGEIEAIRNDFRGEDIGGVISVVVPWREVKQGSYFISVYNAWEPPDQTSGGARLDTQAQAMNYRISVRLRA